MFLYWQYLKIAEFMDNAIVESNSIIAAGSVNLDIFFIRLFFNNDNRFLRQFR